MNAVREICIAEEFSKYPGGRVYADGEFSGERFREEYLVPALRENEKVVVQMDGALGYGSSFLEEAFGGLIRQGIVDKEGFKKRVEIVCEEDETLQLEILGYVEHAI